MNDNINFFNIVLKWKTASVSCTEASLKLHCLPLIASLSLVRESEVIAGILFLSLLKNLFIAVQRPLRTC